jgi:hypothetical protein
MLWIKTLTVQIFIELVIPTLLKVYISIIMIFVFHFESEHLHMPLLKHMYLVTLSLFDELFFKPQFSGASLVF